MGIVVLVLFIAIEVFGEKDGLELFNIDPYGIPRRRLQVKEDFVWEKVIADALGQSMVLVMSDNLVSLHSPPDLV